METGAIRQCELNNRTSQIHLNPYFIRCRIWKQAYLIGNRTGITQQEIRTTQEAIGIT